MLIRLVKFVLQFSWFASSFAVPSASPSQARNTDNDKTVSLSLPTNENAIISNITSAPHPLNAANTAVTCFDNPSYPARAIYGNIKLEECMSVLLTVLLEPDITDEIEWTPYDPVWLPYAYDFGQCKIEISTRFANAKDLFREVLVLQKAASILDRCVRQRPEYQRYGGTVSIGPKGAFQITVAHV